MKKLLLLYLIQLAYGMEADEHWISASRITEFLKTNMLKKTTVYFNAEATKTNTKNKLNINILANQPNLFFFYGQKLNVLLTKIEEKKYQSILEEAQRYNKNNKIIIETDEQWNQRNKKNQNKFSFIAIETTEESNNILNYQVFLNALNNAIREDNEDIKMPLFTCEISNNFNNKAYREEYKKIPDNLKKLVKIHIEDLVSFIEIFKKNDNEEYFQHQEKLKREIEEKKKQEIITFVNKKKEEKSCKTNDITKEQLRSKNYFRSEDIIEIWKTLNEKIQTRINKEIKKFGEIKISIKPCFTEKFCYHGNEFEKYVHSLNEHEAYVLSSLIPSTKENIEFIKIIRSEIEDRNYTLPTVFNNFLIALIKDSIENHKKNPELFTTNITSIENLLLGENGIRYLYRKNKQENFREITADEFKEIFYQDDNRIDNLIDSELNFLIQEIEKILQQKHYMVEIK
jgi:hypothetical protein